MKQKVRMHREPYYNWKIINMTLAGIVLFLALLILLGGQRGWLIPGAYLTGSVMCALSGIMELAKNKKVAGYISSVFSGLLAVAFLVSVIRSIWWKI